MLSRIRPTKILVSGDFLLDSYTIGCAERISPEAPVAVVHVSKEQHRPGGAGNVVLNLIALGAEVKTLGRVGSDETGDRLIRTLSEEGANSSGLLSEPGYSTPLKNRIIASNQQVVRIDYEDLSPLSEPFEQMIIDRLPEFLQGIELIALSDYRKGFLTPTLLRALIEAAKERSIPVITDPKGRDFTKYKGTTLIKPNLAEAYAASGLDSDVALERVAEKLFEQTQAESIMITRSQEGISLFYPDGSRKDFPVSIREIKDVTGAGDTVLAALSCAYASGLNLEQAAEIANSAAGIAIERFGCARVSLQDLARRLLYKDVENKIFDEQHLYTLKQALIDRPCTIISISSAQGITNGLLEALRKYGGNSKRDLVLYVRDSSPCKEFIYFLTQHQGVQFILVDGHSLLDLAGAIRTNAIYVLDKGQLKKLDCPNHCL